MQVAIHLNSPLFPRQVAHRKPHDVTKLEAQVRHLRGQLRNPKPSAAAAAGRLSDKSTRQSKEKLLEWSLQTVEQLASEQATAGS